ncbi:hypothetical protein PRIC1_004607 [Phytophthora ramorum]|nr:hypothetical protein KRP23_4361 [Phytophthora ramorum]KAH7507310.1 hypothetical protein KRP22_2412 [Phytophthora ramorum]
MDARGPSVSSVTNLRPSILSSPRVAPWAGSFTNQTVRDSVLSLSSPTMADTLVRPGNMKLQHTSSLLRLELQWTSAFKMQLTVVRNAVVCCLCAVVANGCFYLGNAFAFKSSVDQSLREFVMAMLVWMGISYWVIMIFAHVPSLTTQRFLECPNIRPSFWLCTKKIVKKSRLSFAATLAGMVAVGLVVQNTSLLHEHFRYRLHFYLAVVCNSMVSTGVMLAVRKIYYKETRQGRERRSAVNAISRARTKATSPRRKAHRPPRYRSLTFGREYLDQIPSAVMIIVAGGYVHAVLVLWDEIVNEASVMVFTVFGLLLKLSLQEAARHYVLKKRVQSVRTMCMLVGVPTVLIDTQTRIVLLGTQSNSSVFAGTFGMAMTELCLRATKAALVVWSTRRRSRALEEKLLEISGGTAARSRRKSTASVKLEHELWRRQIISYHTAELTADMYAEYIAIGCSQSIVFWWLGHPLYPVLRIEGGSSVSEIEFARIRFNHVVMLGFQSVAEIFVDYFCIVLEMAAGIDFDKIENLSSFLGALFMTLAVVNISISSGVYLG